MPSTPNSADLHCPNCGPLAAFASGARAAGSLVPRFCPTCGAALATRASAVDQPNSDDRVFSAEEIIAWRAWRVVRLGKLIRLGSVTHQVEPWPVADWVYAKCDGGFHCPRSSDGRVPGEHHHCGLYAAKDYKHLTEVLPYADYGQRGDDEIRVIGQVAMAGKVIEGTQGWKAERARLFHLYVPHTHWKLGKQIAEQYHVPYDTIRWLG